MMDLTKLNLSLLLAFSSLKKGLLKSPIPLTNVFYCAWRVLESNVNVLKGLGEMVVFV
jgi:hypothetical protein